MAWVNIKTIFEKQRADLSIGLYNIYVSKYSEMKKKIDEAGGRFDVYVDEDLKEVMFVPNSKGAYKFVSLKSGYEYRFGTYLGRTIAGILPRGKYKVRKTVFNKKVAFVVGANDAVYVRVSEEENVID